MVAELSSPVNDFAYLSTDGLTVYLVRGGLSEILRASRPDRTTAFSIPVLDADLDTPALDNNPALSGDGLHAILDQQVDAVLGRELFLMRRATVALPWGDPVRIEGVSTRGLEAAGSLDERALMLVFHTVRGPTTDGDLYVATRASTNEPFSFAMTSPIQEVNTAAYEADPHVSPDGRTLLFTRDNALFMATR